MRTSSLPSVVVDGVHKCFEIPREQISTLKERALHPFRRSQMDVLQALRGISFQVAQGEFFGIVGRNGSGKSTLLKCLAGIYGVDGGNIYVNGRMSVFIELGVGFNPDLPARDNAMLNATMLGLSPREARRRFDSVIDFAELRDFVDLKIKNYSSGMLVRLAFSVMIHVDAEILLIDEVLAVGDAAFQQKCFDEFERIRASGSTVLFVTHDMSAVQRFCDRALLLEHGRPVLLGDPQSVGSRYLELNFSQQARQAEAAAQEGESAVPEQAVHEPHDEIALPLNEEGAQESGGPAMRREGDGRAEIIEAWFEDHDGHRTETLPNGRHCAFAATVRFREDVENPLFALSMRNAHRDNVLSIASEHEGSRASRFHGGEIVTFRVSFENVLAPDRYHVTPGVMRRGGAWIDRCEDLLSIVVTGSRRSGGLIELPYELSLQRGADLPAAQLEATR
jgi:ABC-type polysaccharide/polyol phosphate transport system ATPase subunit